jgi:hypothetical protein
MYLVQWTNFKPWVRVDRYQFYIYDVHSKLANRTLNTTIKELE